jgi:group I intron endonuclease
MSARKHFEEIPNSSGIYQIRCNQNGKIYVGSAADLCARWRAHRRDLCNGVHVNPHLQQAWNLYGEASFAFTVLEPVEPPRLLVREQDWIELTGCTDRRIGFNIKPEATCAGLGIGRTWLGFRDPNGNAVTIVNLSDFCRRESLNAGSMHSLAKGRSKLKSHKGWTHVNSVRQRDYIKTHDGFVDPDGRRVEPIRNLAAFCRERGLDGTHMTGVARGRIVSHQGWTHIRGRKRLPPLVHKGFVAPGGAVVRITNLSAFCRACDLCLVHMFELKSGRRPSHKGWTWKHDADQAFE